MQCFLHIPIHLLINEAVHTVAFGKSIGEIVSMFPHALRHIRRNTT